VGNLADRDGDIQAWFGEVRRREPGHRAEGIIRAKANRRLAPGAAPWYLWAEMQPTCSLGTRTIARLRQPARPPRPVTLAVTAQPVTFDGARRPGGNLPPVTVSAVYAQEPTPPAGEDAVAWLVRTSLPVTDCPRAGLVGQGYRGRWAMERFCRVLKQGGTIAQWRVPTEQRFLHALALDVLVAWRLHTITLAGRASPEGSCEVVCEPQEWAPL
jgi:hypothetical protein